MRGRIERATTSVAPCDRTASAQARTDRSMHQHADSTLSAGEGGTREDSFAERTRRLSLLFELDQALSRAASQHNLAADLVRHDWPSSR